MKKKREKNFSLHHLYEGVKKKPEKKKLFQSALLPSLPVTRKERKKEDQKKEGRREQRERALS